MMLIMSSAIPLCLHPITKSWTCLISRSLHPCSLGGGRDSTRAKMDSDYDNDTTHRKSVTEIAMKIVGGSVFYKTNFQSTVDLSSTEVEFIAACEAVKVVLYI